MYIYIRRATFERINVCKNSAVNAKVTHIFLCFGKFKLCVRVCECVWYLMCVQFSIDKWMHGKKIYTFELKNNNNNINKTKDTPRLISNSNNNRWIKCEYIYYSNVGQRNEMKRTETERRSKKYKTFTHITTMCMQSVSLAFVNESHSSDISFFFFGCLHTVHSRCFLL